MDYTKYQIKWLSNRLSPAFFKVAENLMLSIELDNPKDYE
jgi:hypothetical protein